MSETVINAPLKKSAKEIQILLSIMMFIQFFIWGAWYVSMAPFMGEHGMGDWIGRAYTLGPIAAIISPFFLGMIADRFFASQRVLGAMHLLGALAMFAIPFVIPAIVPDPKVPGTMMMAEGESALPFLSLVFVHSLFYMPTINLTNSVAFANLSDQEKQFPYIRVFGTFGWIAANLVVSLIKADVAVGQFQLAGCAAVALAMFSFFLPNTPPPAKGKKFNAREILGLDALSLFRSRSFAVFALSSFLICIPLAAYYSYAAGTVKVALTVLKEREKGGTPKVAIPPSTVPATVPATRASATVPSSTQATTAATAKTAPAPEEPLPVTAWMSIGQAAEVVFMLIMPFFFRKLGVKWMLAVGMLSWGLRYALFAVGITGPTFILIMLGVALHGLCYDFFFVTGFIYTDKRAAKQISGQAQGLMVLLTYGLGLAVGGYLTGELYNHIVGTKKVGTELLEAIQKFWIWPCGFALVVLIIFTALFRDDTNELPIGPDTETTIR